MGIFKGLKSYAKPATPAQPAPPPDLPKEQISDSPRRPHNGSSRASIAPSASGQSVRSEYPEFETLKYEVMVNHILQVALREGLVQNAGIESEGVFLRRAREDYISLPPLHNHLNTPLLQAVKQLNPMVGYSPKQNPKTSH